MLYGPRGSKRRWYRWIKPKKREGIVTFQLIPNEKVASDTSYGTPSKIVLDGQDNLVNKTTENMATSCKSKRCLEKTWKMDAIPRTY